MESEPAGRKHLEHSARHLAKSLTITANRPRGLLLLERLTENTRKLVAAYRRFNRAPEDALTLSYTAEWILDNFYVVQRAERQLLEDLPPSYYRQLPKLANSPMVGYPRIYALARACLARCQGNLDLASVRHFVTAFQRVTPLTMGELWALPSMLRLAAIDKLAHAVTRVADIGVASNKGTTNGIPPRATSEEDAIVADSIRALRLLETSDWRVFFESVSQVEQILRSDPAGVYAKMDPGTRDRYRKVIEILASATGMVEPEVATVAIRIAAQAEKRLRSKAGPGTPSRRPLPARAAHVGFYLMDGGRKELEQVLGYRPSVRGRMRRWIVDHATFAYLGSILLATSGILVAACSYVASAGGNVLQVIAAGMLLAIAAVSVVVDVLGWLITHLLKPLVLPQLDFRKGLPEDQRTMVVMPALLANAEEVDSLLGNLELHFLRNTDPNIFFALLTDFCDAPREAMPGDETLVAQAKAGIRHLNNKYAKQADQPFFLFHRRRLWNPGESCWMGWERKRGKLMEFNRLLRECPDSSFSVQLGQLGLLPTIRYVITLDADTDLTRGSARRLVATLAHPLNRAEFDSVTGVVRAGYTVLQPRVEVRPTSAHRSRFVEIFAQAAGPDLYTRAVSDAYQDLFGEGSFVGKGIYDVDAFMRSLDRRIPENTILSHDMLEGLYGRAGLLTGVVMYEDYPPHYPAYTRRWHRWVRGDWQLLPLLLPGFGTPEERRRRVGLSALDRWKILDNLRRSMLGPGLLALLVSGWTWLPGSALMWTLFGISIPAVPALIDVLTVATGRPRGRYLLARSRPLRLDSLRWLLAVSFLPFEALLAVDAIARTLARLAITRRHLLQWTTAASTLRALGQGVTRAQIWKQMIGGPVASLGITALVEVARPTALPIAAPLLIAWLVSPQIAYWVGRPRAVEQTRLSPEERQALCRLARRTWLFFEQFVGPSDHWLPPDHFQEEPKGVVAHRTSPTNIGLMLLSTLTAFDFGFIGFLSLEYRLRDTFRTLNRLTRYRGHFLNWYNTSSLEPLPPAYVSTVDSGNLAGCLLTLRQGCLGLAATPLLRWERRQGLLDTLAVLIELLDGVQAPDAATHLASLRAELKEMRRQILEVRDRPGEWASLVTRLADEVLGSLDRHLLPLVTARPSTLDASRLHNLRIWIRRVHHHLDTSQRELNLLMPWLTALSQPPELLAQSSHPDIAEAWRGFLASLPVSPRLDGVAVICGDAQERLTRLQAMLADQDEATKSIKKARDWCTDLTRKLRLAATRVEALLQSFLEVSNQAAAFVQDMDFRFLFDSRRHLLHIGYNTETESLDENYYDLMASEARLASYVAIAKGDVPQSHWLHLGRPLTQVDHSRALLSWTGTMFEYLMPTLMMRSFEGSLVDQSNHAAVDFQIRYCEQRGVPWGVSESGYYRFDTNRNYQYRAFGVEGLGLKRGLGEDLVISPYASLLALPIRPGAVLHNLGQLAEMKMLGPFGFYEALDFTPSRLATGQPHALVKSYMAHHQGMILLSLANLLQDRKMINRFHADPRVQSIELLLQEDLPRDIPLQPTPPDGVGTVIPTSEHSLVRPWQVSAQASPPMVHYLSNGRYGLMVTAAGAGYSHWQGMDLTRWRSDTSLDDTGSWIYLRDEDSKELWSATAQPIAAKKGTQEAFFYPHQVTFHRREHDLAIETDLTIPPEDDIEVRRLRLISHSTRPRRLSLTSYAEVTLASHDIDSRHEAFNKLFIESEFLPGLDALMFRRRLRSPQETPVYLIHMLVQPNGKPD
ncbi:MAG: cellobiose phosphorylase, partial [Bacteroidia bacterium]|nr:cellobiose phosphorylase [Bacteroidia bacterium]